MFLGAPIYWSADNILGSMFCIDSVIKREHRKKAPLQSTQPLQKTQLDQLSKHAPVINQNSGCVVCLQCIHFFSSTVGSIPYNQSREVLAVILFFQHNTLGCDRE